MSQTLQQLFETRSLQMVVSTLNDEIMKSRNFFNIIIHPMYSRSWTFFFFLLRCFWLQYAMFYGASSFNQDISSWSVSNGQQFVSTLKDEIMKSRILVNSFNNIIHPMYSLPWSSSFLLTTMLLCELITVGHVWWCIII